MKTIFDLAVTDAEMDDILGQAMSADEYKKIRTGDDEILGDVYCLLRYRGNNAEADEILGQIGDKNFAESLKASL